MEFHYCAFTEFIEQFPHEMMTIIAGRVLERGQSEIRYQYDEVVKVKTCLLVTWDKMQPLGATPLPEDVRTICFVFCPAQFLSFVV